MHAHACMHAEKGKVYCCRFVTRSGMHVVYFYHATNEAVASGMLYVFNLIILNDPAIGAGTILSGLA